MSDETGAATATLERNLRRLQALTAALDNVADAHARESARELLEIVLDLHGLALARMSTLISGNQPDLMRQLAADARVSAILLLHGLHPKDPGERLRGAIEGMRPRWSARGFRVELMSVDRVTANVRVYKNGCGESADALRRLVGDALVEAAPDLDEIVVEIDDIDPGRVTAAAM